ncbi:MAG: activase, partial [FCB group bacterium]|nr:activase [FCB group bacterium]
YGQTNLKGAVRIKEHPQLFGTYITNFSCGPDSFIIGYFRDILGRKPSLTLELDNHTADAGLETRIEAFLDIVARYRKVQADECAEKSEIYTPARTRMEENKLSIITSEGEELSIKDPRVRVVMASMGQYATGAMDAVLSGMGVHPVALPQMGEDELKLGRGNTMCKECLPLLLTTGALVKYLRNDRPDDEVTVYFMPTAEGPCRFGQYKDYMTDFVKKRRIKNVAFLSPSSRDSYAGLGSEFIKAGWRGVLVADIFEDIHHAMLINAVDRDSAFEELARIWEYVLEKMKGSESDLYSGLEKAAGELAEIPMKGPVDQLPHALIVGEIYVRKEGLSRRWLPERLAEQGIVSHVAPVHEWLYYLDWLIANRLSDKVHTTFERMKNALKVAFMRRIEKKIKAVMAQSGWYISRIVDIDHVIQAGGHYISPQLTGEAVLTVGGPLAEVGNEFCGAIAIGPFGCMPNRISESILNLKMDRDNIIKFRTDDLTDKVTHEVGNLPFLAIESDGSPFPQLIEARLETFVVQALRLHDVMQKHKG